MKLGGDMNTLILVTGGASFDIMKDMINLKKIKKTIQTCLTKYMHS